MRHLPQPLATFDLERGCVTSFCCITASEGAGTTRPMRRGTRGRRVIRIGHAFTPCLSPPRSPPFCPLPHSCHHSVTHLELYSPYGPNIFHAIGRGLEPYCRRGRIAPSRGFTELKIEGAHFGVRPPPEADAWTTPRMREGWGNGWKSSEVMGLKPMGHRATLQLYGGAQCTD